MTPEEIEGSTDVDALYTQLRAAKAFDDHRTVRLIEARMRDLAGHNTRSDDRQGKSIAVDAVNRARIRSAGESGGSA